jgi:hypothetical protein
VWSEISGLIGDGESERCKAGRLEQPATSYNGEGEHNRLQISAATASPTDNC